MFERPISSLIQERLKAPRQHMQMIYGGRQVGKTTLMKQALNTLSVPYLYVIAESGYVQSWIDQRWAHARSLAAQHPEGAILVIDEVQKILNWSERVKRLWDEDTFYQKNLKVVLLGSSALLLQKGLSESMAGRFEAIHVSHWSYKECVDAFGVSLDQYMYFGAYPGALTYIHDETRFMQYMRDSIISPIVDRDILLENVIQKPALLQQLFHFGVDYSGQILSYNKMLGQLQDAGNTTTLAYYFTLLSQNFVLRGLPKFSASQIRQRQSSPKLQVYNTAFMGAVYGKDFHTLSQNSRQKGRWVESMVGTWLLMQPHAQVYYWRENNAEVDFILEVKGKIIAIEVKSGIVKEIQSGLDTFAQKYHPNTQVVVGSGGIPIEDFMQTPLTHFL